MCNFKCPEIAIVNMLLQDSKQYSTAFSLKEFGNNFSLSIEIKVKLYFSCLAVNIISC